MTERLRSGNNFVNSANITAKMSNDLTPRKTMLIIVIVVGCFAVLWPKVFYPMLVGSANQHIKPSPIDKTTGCCDVISEIDVNTIKIMSELCKTIIKKDEDMPLTVKEMVEKCRSAVLETCGIDISAVLQQQVRLGQSVKQILDEVRSLNGSLCLKYNFGVAPWRLGVPHRVTVKVSSANIRQERPLHLRSELVHPAFRERGRAIPQPQVTSSRTTARVVEGRPGPIPGLRPTLGGAGHVVPPPKQSTGSMGLIMPIYTIGIVIFFTYTVLKIIFKKQPEALYPPVEPDPNFRREVFESNRGHAAPKLTREGVSSKLGDAELDQLRQRLRETELAMERIVEQMAKVPLKLQSVVANGNLPQEEEQSTVKVLGMETTASCEGGKKWSRPNSPVLPASSPPQQEAAEPPQEIYLEGALPAQSHLLVADSATKAEKNSSGEDPAVVLAGKMTLSVISLDSSEHGTDDSSNLERKQTERSSSNVSEDFEKIEAEEPLHDVEGALSVQQSADIQLLEQIQNEIKETDESKIITNLESEVNPVGLNDEQSKEQITENVLAISQTETEFIEEESKQYDKLPNSDIEDADLPGTRDDEINIKEKLSEIETLPEDINKKDQLEISLPDDINTDEKISTLEDTHNKLDASSLNEEKGTISSLQLSSNDNIEPEEQSTQEEKISEQIAPDITEESAEATGAESLPSSNASESLVSSTISEPPISNNVSDSISSSNISELLESNDISVVSNAPETDTNLQEQNLQDNLEGDLVKNENSQSDNNENNSQLTETIELVPSNEKETFEKLNQAISDLSSEFPTVEKVEDEQDEAPDEGLDNDEEIEYEYEDSDDEEVEEDVCNVNGENQELSKYGTTNSATLAENDISDEDILEDEDDEEIQEIIEYITDDEEEVEDVVEPVRTNNTNHLPEDTGPH